MHKSLTLKFLFPLLLTLSVEAANAQLTSSCGSIYNSYGPFDYRTANTQQRSLVEGAHFTPGVESLTHGKTGPFGGDIGYTLGVFPNHHRALVSMARLAEKEKADPPKDAQLTVVCFYERAIQFRSDDLIVRMLYAGYLIGKKRSADAVKQLEFVREQAADNAFTQYNVGMLYADMQDYDRALIQAHLAESQGFERPDLRKRLVDAGKWREPVRSATPQPTQASAPSD